jgi:hypothetical protein
MHASPKKSPATSINPVAKRTAKSSVIWKVVQQSLQSGSPQQILHVGFLVSSIVGWRFFGFFFLCKVNCRVLSVWTKERKKNNQRTAGFFRYLFEKSESKNHWFQLFQTPQRTARFHERTGNEPMVF